MRGRIVAGNWKMNGSLAANARLLSALASAKHTAASPEILVCVPHVYVQQAVAAVGGRVAVGGQDLSEHDAGAYTGEVSGAMLRDTGASHVIVGHSERRSLHGETDAVCVRKWQAARRHGLIPVFCVGETLAEREAGQAGQVLSRQISALLEVADSLDGWVLAYEPVWAIGTGRTATAAQAQEIHALLRAEVAKANAVAAAQLPILYGGSVRAPSAASLFACPDIDGALVGGASLDAEEFMQICQAAERPGHS